MNINETLMIIGERVKRYRLNANLTRKAVAETAGVGVASLARLEGGHGANLSVFIRILDALQLHPVWDDFLPMPEFSPIQLAKLKGKQRQRASIRKEK